MSNELWLTKRYRILPIIKSVILSIFSTIFHFASYQAPISKLWHQREGHFHQRFLQKYMPNADVIPFRVVLTNILLTNILFDNIKHLCDPWISAPLFEATASCQLPINQVRLNSHPIPCNSHPIPCNCCVILVRRLLGFMLLKFAMILQCMISFSFIEFIFHFAGKYPHLCVCSEGKHIHAGQNAQYGLG